MRPLVASLIAALLLSAAHAGPADTLNLAVLSDFNGPYGSTTYPAELSGAMRQILRWQPDAVLSAGDLIAGQKASLSNAQVQAMWAAFDRDVQGPLRNAGIPFAFTLGNHDAAHARDRREAARYWQAHRPTLTYADTRRFPFEYSFTLAAPSGKTLFVAVIDAPQADLSDQTLTWLQGQLTSAAAQQAGARLVLGHLPLAGISEGKNRPGEVLNLADAQALARIMQQTETLAYVSGHHAAAFPGRWHGVNTLATGGIGGRDYLGHPGSDRSTVTRLTVELASSTATFAIVDTSTGKQLNPSDFPARLDGLNGPLIRVDRLE